MFLCPGGLPVTRMNINEAICEALFASSLQPSDSLTADMVADAIGSTIRRLGAGGCGSYVAAEFGDHPEQAVSRMRWIRQLSSELCGISYLPAALPTTATEAGTDLLPVREAA